MLKNYLKTAWRNLKRQKVFSFINIMGLAIGLAACLLMLLFVQNQLSYDRYNKDADRIVRVVFEGNMDGGKIREADVMPPVAKTFKKDFPEVLDATRIRTYGKPSITYANNTFKNNALAFVDANFFRMFTIPLLKGDKHTALTKPNTVVISKAAATQFFGHENPIGKSLSLKNSNTLLEITGVFDKIPDNSHFHFDLLASMTTLPEARKSTWLTSNFYTYLLLPKGYNYKKLQAKLPQEAEKYIGPQLQEAMGISFSKFKASGNSVGFRLQPLTDIHLHSDVSDELQPPGNIQYVYIFSLAALFMLLIACINFMNLSTAGASKRAKEIGVRKALGSFRKQLIVQFLAESFLVTIIAMLIALCLIDVAVPLFSQLAGQNLMPRWSSNLWLLPVLGLLVLFIGVLAGSYPAFYLSSFNPLNVMKSRFYSGKKGVGLRKGLVVFQFFISISLILGTLVIYNQLSFIRHKKLGYNKNHVMIIENTRWLGHNQMAFKNELLHDSRVANASYSGYLPAGPSNRNNFMVYPDGRSSELVLTLRYGIDYNYIPTLGMHITAGRNFSKAHGADSLGIIINEAAVKAFGWEKKALGHQLTRVNNNGIAATYHVIGVVKNFNFRSLHQWITPLVMTLERNRSNLIVKVNTAQTASLLSSIKTKWDALAPESPFTYSFLNDRFNNTYKTEQNMGFLLGIFAGLTIFIACLGLFGLVIFSVEKRTKEIGIRKVLGASVANIIPLLSKDFLKLVMMGFILAAPVAWYAMHRWLQSFAYKTRISPWIFLLAGGVALLVALATVSWQSIKAALANPVDSLRSE